MTVNDLEQIKRVILEPTVAALKQELSNHVDNVTLIVDGGMKRVDAMDKRVNALEANQRKALMGWGALTLAVGTAVTAGWNYIRSHLKIG